MIRPSMLISGPSMESWGRGLLQQGQSLESSLRTTGLEMGMLRVTVDQQQGRGEILRGCFNNSNSRSPIISEYVSGPGA